MLWPLAQSYSKLLPSNGEMGCFWEFRDDRFHCGVDIYAPVGSPVSAIEDGIVLDMGLFTSPKFDHYLEVSFHVLIAHSSGIVARYAQLDSAILECDDCIRQGQFIANTCRVLNLPQIDEHSPRYIQKLKQKNNLAMLHLEMFSSYPICIPKYYAGNTFQKRKPCCLLDPMQFLQ